MITLFISTYSEFVTIGLLNNGKEIARKEEKSLNGHSTIIVPSIDLILKDNNLEPQDLDEILVVNGPGSFTGVRLGITVAKTLAYTLNIPIKTITSIEALAASIKNVDKIITIDDPKGKYIGKFINNKMVEMLYLKEEEALKYIENEKIPAFEESNLSLEAIYDYSKNLEETPAHAVKACYVKGIEALNGK